MYIINIFFCGVNVMFKRKKVGKRKEGMPFRAGMQKANRRRPRRRTNRTTSSQPTENPPPPKKK